MLEINEKKDSEDRTHGKQRIIFQENETIQDTENDCLINSGEKNDLETYLYEDGADITKYFIVSSYTIFEHQSTGMEFCKRNMQSWRLRYRESQLHQSC
ncbi:hypothetical protein ASD24_29740 [Paenibacillus sp. Root52]|nr:hypothetical protein ASD24_29740 [Paenibacillus sp. Root52]